MHKITLFLLICLFPLAALAQTAPQPGPCTRGAQTIRLGKLDLDVERCQIVILESTIGSLESQVAALRASALLTAQDTTNAQKASAEREAWWMRCGADGKCLAWLSSAIKPAHK